MSPWGCEPGHESAALQTVVSVVHRIKDALQEIDPERDLSKLTGENTYKFWVGDYRVIVDWDQCGDTVYVLTLGHRRNFCDQNWKGKEASLTHMQHSRLKCLKQLFSKISQVTPNEFGLSWADQRNSCVILNLIHDRSDVYKV